MGRCVERRPFYVLGIQPEYVMHAFLKIADLFCICTHFALTLYFNGVVLSGSCPF